MYKVRIKAKAHWSRKDVRKVHRAASWAANYLNIGASPVPIHIKLCGPSTDFGDCLDLDSKILIRLYAHPRWERTLFHELVHVRQYLFGELELDFSFAYWHGERFDRKKLKYLDEPWEIEARKLERKMWKKYLDF